MSKYTTEVRYICETSAGLSESVGENSVEDVIANSRAKIFNFNYPIFDEAYRPVLETKILKHFYTREIGEETVGLWKLRLNTKLNEIMPYYNKLYLSELIEFDPMYTTNIKKKGNKTTDEGINDTSKTIGNVESENSTSEETDGRGSSSNTMYNMYSDTPQGSLVGVDNETYLTNATKETNNGNSTSHNEGNASSNGKVVSNEDRTYGRERNNIDDYVEDIIGFSGQSGSKLLNEFRDTFLNIDMLIINDLEPLFFGLW